MKYDVWQSFKSGAVVVTRPRRHTVEIMGYTLRPDRKFRAMVSYMEVVDPPVEGVDCIGVNEGFDALRPWAARQRAIRSLRRNKRGS